MSNLFGMREAFVANPLGAVTLGVLYRTLTLAAGIKIKIIYAFKTSVNFDLFRTISICCGNCNDSKIK